MRTSQNTSSFKHLGNKGKRRGRTGATIMPWSSRFIRLLGAYADNNTTTLADEVESIDYLVSTRFEAFLAPHTGVLLRAAGNGIYASRW